MVRERVNFAGAYSYPYERVVAILNEIATILRDGSSKRDFELVGGSFTLREAHPTWSNALMLGALDYYRVKEISAFQVVPDKGHLTIDVPDMTAAWDQTKAPAWRWLSDKWTFPVPECSWAITNLAALRGEQVTEVARWEEDQWEMFAGAGPDVPKEETRAVPLGVLIGADPSLSEATTLPIGEGLWRDESSLWHPWRKRDDGAE